MALLLLVKATIALLLGIGAASLAGRARASVRHLLLASTLGVLAILPLASSLAPPVAIEVPIVRPSGTRTPAAAPTLAAVLESTVSGGTGALVRSRYGATWVLGIWLAGAVVCGVPLIAALRRVRHLRRTALPWTAGERFVLGRSAEVLLHEEVTAPLTFGLLRPAIVLPVDAPTWSDAQLRLAFLHEFEHVQRADWWVQACSRAVCAAYWFHPLAWIAWRRLALEAERACDDAVLREADGVGYADQLVSLARRAGTRGPQPLLSMAGRSDLAQRVHAILDTRQARGPVGRAAPVPVIALATLFVVIVAPLNGLTRQEVFPVPATVDLALMEAAERGDARGVATLLKQGAEPDVRMFGDGSPLIAAARDGHRDVVRLLLDAGADPNLAVNGDGNPLIMAALRGETGIAELLIARGADVDAVVAGDETPLINASAQGHLDTVELLVERGADVNLGAWAGYAPERPGDQFRTPLNMAERRGHGSVADYLRSRGATR